MQIFTRRRTARSALAAGLGALSLTVAACSSGSSTPAATGTGSAGSGSSASQQAGTAGLTVPTANLPVLQQVGKGEGQLNLIAWEGYLDPSWVKPFEQQTGCTINAKYAGSSDEMVSRAGNVTAIVRSNHSRMRDPLDPYKTRPAVANPAGRVACRGAVRALQ